MLELLDAAGNDGLTSTELHAIEPELFRDTTAASGTLNALYVHRRVPRVRDSSGSKHVKWHYRYFHPKSARGQVLLGRKPIPVAEKIGSTPVLNGDSPLVRVEKQIVLNLGGQDHVLNDKAAKTLLLSLSTLLGVRVHS